MVNSGNVGPAGISGGNSSVLEIERRHIVEEAERRCRGELEQMRRELDTLKESLQDQVDSEDVRWRITVEGSCLVVYMLDVLELWTCCKRQV